MAGTIRTYQKCPRCGAPFPSSKGGSEIVCKAGCHTRPTKYFIDVFWKGRHEQIYRDSGGQAMKEWGHAVATMGEIRSRMVAHRSGRGDI